MPLIYIIKVMNKKQSSSKEATKASKALSNPHSSKLTKSLAGSVLSQAKGTGRKKH
ncbi:MAG: hypothetical protein JST50_19750 [Bacteroidetes bacterium]|jgi:hypothetical protein|nr:hypothetical protein [Bacteroidota bacterium]